MKLKRWVGTPDGTLGKMASFYTMEEENLGNQKNISRIPAGTYKCVRTWFNKGGYATFEITGVPNRTNILFHRGNTEEDSDGCILLGTTVGVLSVTDEDSGKKKHKLAVLNSRAAFTWFMKSREGVEYFWLDIEDEDVESVDE